MNLPIILSLPFQNQEGATDLSFLAYLDIWLIGGLVMLAVVVVVGKWLWGKLRRRPEEDDGRYHDEDYYFDNDR